MSSGRLYVLMLFLLPFAFVGVANFIFDFNGLYGQDAHRYFQYVSELEAYIKNGKALGEFHWSILFPLAGLIVKSIFGINTALALQLISAVSLGLGSVFLYKILKRQNSQNTFLFSLVFLVFCPQLSVASVLCMSDLFSMMWVVLAWYFYFEWKRNGKIITALNLTAVAALATISRYPAFLLVMIPLVVAFFNLLSKRRWWALLMPILFFLFCLPELALHQTVDSISGNYQLNHWSISNWFKSLFETNDGSQQYRFINLIYITYPVWHPAYFITGFGLAVFSILRFPFKNWSSILLISIVSYLLFVGGIEFQNRRFFILVFPLILIMIYRLGFGTMLNTISNKVLGLCFVFLIIFQGAIATYYLRPLIEMNHFEQKLTEDLQAYQGNRLYIFCWDLSLQSYDAQFEFHNLWEEEVKHCAKGDLILFNPEELQEQWEGKKVMNNWNFINQNYNLEVLETWPNGWKLYGIQ